MDWAALRESYARDGVVHLPRALDEQALAEARAAFEWSLAHPGPFASRLPQREDGVFLNDLYNPDCLTGYRAMLEASPLPALVQALWGGGPVWFMYEQVFLKEGAARRTPWHQDSSYLSIKGPDLAVVWISFDALEASDSLEFVRGSHHGALYSGSRFDPADDTAPLSETSKLPRLPEIEADRRAWDIVSFPVQPGDAIVFHPDLLHGGAATAAGGRRRTLTLRFFGERAFYDARDSGAGPPIAGFHQRMKTGEPFRDPRFLQLRA